MGTKQYNADVQNVNKILFLLGFVFSEGKSSLEGSNVTKKEKIAEARS